MSERPQDPWDSGTWSGSRRAQLRRALAMAVRERLEAMEAAAEVGQRLAVAPRRPAADPERAIEDGADQ